jgi:hypothetical protein
MLTLDMVALPAYFLIDGFIVFCKKMGTRSFHPDINIDFAFILINFISFIYY